MKMRNIKQAKLKPGMKVLVRVDYNVALDKKSRVEKGELFRIKRTVPTIKYLIKKRARIIILAHLGRPGGIFNQSLSNKPLGLALGKILGKPVKVLSGVVEDKIKKQIDNLKPGQVVILENLRFYPGEEKNSKNFARSLANLGNIYVNDAFASIHRESASLLGVTNYLPSYAGLLLKEEIENLTRLILRARKPLVFVMGGAKVGTKLPFIQKLLPKADKILVGGIIANTILKNSKYSLGSSVYEKKFVNQSRRLLKNSKIKLPVDVICDNITTSKIEAVQKNIGELKKNDRIIDIGTISAVEFALEIRKAKTVFFNGPLGFMEKTAGRHASQAIAELIAALSASKKIKSIVGGGETICLFNNLGLADDITYISTGGGALFAFLSNQDLPVLKSLVK